MQLGKQAENYKTVSLVKQQAVLECIQFRLNKNPASILRKSTSGRHRPVSYPDGPMTARYRFT